MKDVITPYIEVIEIRDVKRYRYIAAAALTVMVFSLGILTSDFMDDKRTSGLEDELNQNLVELEDQQLQLSYVDWQDVSCTTMQSSTRDIIEDYNSKLSMVQNFQDRSFFQESQYEQLKKRYILSGVRYWMFAEKLRNRCDQSTNTLLFFVPHLEKEDCEECERMGRELSLMKKDYRDQVLIFTIPTEEMKGIVNLLETRYNITDHPTVVLNGEEKLEGYNSREKLEKTLNLTGN